MHNPHESDRLAGEKLEFRSRLVLIWLKILYQLLLILFFLLG